MNQTPQIHPLLLLPIHSGRFISSHLSSSWKCRDLDASDRISDPVALLSTLEEPLRWIGGHIAEEPVFFTVLCRLLSYILSEVSFPCIAFIAALARLVLPLLHPLHLPVLPAPCALLRPALQSDERGGLERPAATASNRPLLALFVLAGQGTHRGRRSVLLDEAALPRHRLLSASHRLGDRQSDVRRAHVLLLRLSALLLPHGSLQMHHLRQLHRLPTAQSPLHLPPRRRLRALLHRRGPAKPPDFARPRRAAEPGLLVPHAVHRDLREALPLAGRSHRADGLHPEEAAGRRSQSHAHR